VTVLDDDATVTVSTARAFISSAPVAPEDRLGSFTHVLDSQPTGTVRATVMSRNPNVVRPIGIAGTTTGYTFNTSSTDPVSGWNVQRPVLLGAPLRGSSGSTTIVITYSGGGYDGVTVEVPVRVWTTAEIANIPDAGLRAAFETALGKQSDEPIFRDEIPGLTSLRARNRSITNLTGLELATGLTELNLGGNHNLADLRPLSGLGNLRRLNLNGSNVSDLRPLSGLRNLRRLELVNAAVTNVGPLSTVGELRELFLRNNEGISDNAIVDITGLQNLTKLWTLDLRRNQIASLAPLLTNDNFPSSSRLDLHLQGNPLNGAAYDTHIPALRDRDVTVNIDADPLVYIPDAALRTEVERVLNKNAGAAILRSELAGLTTLAMYNRGVADLTGLEYVTGLTTLHLSGHSFSDLTPLSGLTNLSGTLALENNSISDIAPLVANTGLGSGDTINLRGNPLNAAAYSTHIPALQGRGVTVQFDPAPVVSICDRTAAVETAILAAIPGNVACGEVTIVHLAGITSLDLETPSLTALQSGDFAGEML